MDFFKILCVLKILEYFGKIKKYFRRILKCIFFFYNIMCVLKNLEYFEKILKYF